MYFLQTAVRYIQGTGVYYLEALITVIFSAMFAIQRILSGVRKLHVRGAFLLYKTTPAGLRACRPAGACGPVSACRIAGAHGITGACNVQENC
jgi:hypothetical protein